MFNSSYIVDYLKSKIYKTPKKHQKYSHHLMAYPPAGKREHLSGILCRRQSTSIEHQYPDKAFSRRELTLNTNKKGLK